MTTAYLIGSRDNQRKIIEAEKAYAFSEKERDDVYMAILLEGYIPFVVGEARFIDNGIQSKWAIKARIHALIEGKKKVEAEFALEELMEV